MNETLYQAQVDRSIEIRAQFWKSIGNVDPYVLTHLINPAFMNGPTWPALRQAFLKIDTPSSVILTSDGLSDPFEELNELNQGLGMECFMESEELEAQTDMSEINKTWQFQILYQVSQNIANHGRVRELLEHYGVLSMELFDIDLPDAFIDEEGRVGILIGMDAPNIPSKISLPGGEIQMVSVKLITLSELDYIRHHGAEGRRKLVDLFYSHRSYHQSSIHRDSVV
ncbi:suppressor of fused domain protein [Thermoflavimicrobium daqui]|uniref:Uncharacterized protein n=1 Tax=Thermoflavimicrobium daqui TaxID=2137476 RepID=A0A364K4J9_9BACL|nr:suppressor of fused domain protein [Thermoflavimicrobium daqui]RAL24221.1 hypothetical protein DL897_11115 [Thermoflavimicrobium daqui]